MAGLKGLVRCVIHCIKVAPFPQMTESRMDEPHSWCKDTVKFSTSKKVMVGLIENGVKQGHEETGLKIHYKYSDL